MPQFIGIFCVSQSQTRSGSSDDRKLLRLSVRDSRTWWWRTAISSSAQRKAKGFSAHIILTSP
ncbi:unnamed protein product [Arabidopsis lyrata]|nr:unnamed protein product [Arabidopsis lyrata]